MNNYDTLDVFTLTRASVRVIIGLGKPELFESL